MTDSYPQPSPSLLLQKWPNVKTGCPARRPVGLWLESQATGLGRQGRRMGSRSRSNGQVLVRWGKTLESPEAASAGLALTYDIRTQVPGGARAPKPGGQVPEEGASQRLSEPREAVQAPGAQQPFNSTPCPRGHPPQAHLQPHTHSHPCPHPLHTHTQGCRGPGPTPWTLECLWIGTQRVRLPREWVLCVATDWLPRRHLSNRCTRPLVPTDLSR